LLVTISGKHEDATMRYIKSLTTLAAITAAFVAGSWDSAWAIASICNADPNNLLTNCGFETGTNTGFTSNYTFSPGNLLSAGTFAIGNNPDAQNGFFGPPNPPPNSGNDEMIVNGASAANVQVWGEGPIPVVPNTNYNFSVFVASIDGLGGNFAKLDFSANDIQLGSIFDASSTLGLQQQFVATWNSGANTSVNLSLVNQSTAAGGNDFVLDDFDFGTTIQGGTGVGGTGTGTGTGGIPSVPEPGALSLLGSALFGFAAIRRRRRNQKSVKIAGVAGDQQAERR
jgi:hypothetical protein